MSIPSRSPSREPLATEAPTGLLLDTFLPTVTFTTDDIITVTMNGTFSIRLSGTSLLLKRQRGVLKSFDATSFECMLALKETLMTTAKSIRINLQRILEVSILDSITSEDDSIIEQSYQLVMMQETSNLNLIEEFQTKLVNEIESTTFTASLQENSQQSSCGKYESATVISGLSTIETIEVIYPPDQDSSTPEVSVYWSQFIVH